MNDYQSHAPTAVHVGLGCNTDTRVRAAPFHKLSLDAMDDQFPIFKYDMMG
jgi:hypothetical protein